MLNDFSRDGREKIFNFFKKVIEESEEVIIKEFAKNHLEFLGNLFYYYEPEKYKHSSESVSRGDNLFNDYYRNRFIDTDEKLRYPETALFHKELNISRVSKDQYAVFDISLKPIGIVEDNIDSIKWEKPITIKTYEDEFNAVKLEGDEGLKYLMKYIHKPEIMVFVKEKIGVDLRGLSMRDQIYFMQFLAGEDQETFDRLKKLFANEEIDNDKLLKSFLSTAGDLDFGENILTIGERKDYSSEEKNAIFAKYAELAEGVDKIEDLLSENIDINVDDDKNLIESNTNALLEKGKDWLKKMALEERLDPEEFRQKINSNMVDHAMLAASYKQMLQTGAISKIEDLKSVGQYTFNYEDIKDDELLLNQLQKIYFENTKDISEEYAQSRIDKFFTNMRKDGFNLKVIKFKNEIMSFIVAVEGKNQSNGDVVELGAYNANREFYDTTGAVNLLNTILSQYENNDFIINADATPNNARVYIQKYNFIGYGIEGIEGQSNILIQKNPHRQYETQDKELFNRRMIKEKAENGINELDGNIIYKISKESNEIPEEIKNGYIITQSFSDRDNIYYLLEKATIE